MEFVSYDLFLHPGTEKLKNKRQKYKACQVKCDACPACPVGENDHIGVKFEARKYFTRVGAYFTMDKI